MITLNAHLKSSLKLFFTLFVLTLIASACNSAKPSSNTSIDNSKTLKNKVNKTEMVVEAARKQLGTPHTYNNPRKKPSVDCSGMTCKSYATVGITLPRRSQDQALLGKKIKKADLKEGDLVFFSSKKGRKGISHVGLVSKVENGEVYFIHTSTSRGVVEDDFYMPHWQNVFVTARRLL